MKSLYNALLYLGGLVVLLVIALFAIPHFVDWNLYRGVFEEEASRILGREVRVGGKVDLHFLPRPSIRFEKIRIANPEGVTGESLLRADSFTLWLALSPLLKGNLEAQEVELTRPILAIRLETDPRAPAPAFGSGSGALPFIPAGVALRSVRISDGTVRLLATVGQPIANVDHLTGELEADTLTGPYRFRGTYGAPEEASDIRVATGAREPDGSFRVKAAAIGTRFPATTTFDGLIKNLDRAPAVVGDVTTRLPIAALLPEAEKRAAASAKSSSSAEAKAKLVLDVHGADLTAVNISLETADRVQSLTGEAHADWARPATAAPSPGEEETIPPVSWSAKLHAKWLDFDALLPLRSAPGQGVSLVADARELATRLVRIMPTRGTDHVAIDVEQARLRSEGLAGFAADVTRSGSSLAIAQLLSGLPGGGRARLTGTYDLAADALAGHVSAEGPSFGRALSLAGVQGTPPPAYADQPFMIDTDVKAKAGAEEFSNTSLEVGDNRLTGSGSLTSAPSPKLVVQLSAGDVRLPAPLPDWAGLRALSALIERPAGAAEPRSASSDPLASLDFDIHVSAGSITDPSVRLEAVRLAMTRSGGRLVVDDLAFTTPHGIKIGLNGRVEGLDRAPRGEFSVSSRLLPEGLGDLEHALGLADGSLARDRRLDALLPALLVTTVALEGEGGSNIKLDGAVRGGRISGAVRLGGAIGAWKTVPLDGQLSLTGSGALDLAATLMQSIVPARAAAAPDAAQPRTDRTALVGEPSDHVEIQASGRLSEALRARLALSSRFLDLQSEGTVDAPDARFASAAGDVAVKAPDGLALAALLGLSDTLSSPRTDVAGPMSGSLRVALVPGKLSVATIGDSLRVASSDLSGVLDLASGPGGLVAEGSLKASEARLPALLSLVTSGSPAPDASSPWPSSAFDWTLTKRLTGHLRLAANRLALAGGLSLADARADVKLSTDGVEIASLAGTSLGGSVTGSARLGPGPAGARLTSSIGLDGVEASDLAKPAAPDALAGKVALALKLDGDGTSPRDLMRSLAGTGELKLDRLELKRFVPSAILAAATEILVGKEHADPRAIETKIGAALLTGHLPIGTHAIPLVVANGRLKSARVEALQKPGGRLSLEGALDLEKATFDTTLVVSLDAPQLPAQRSAQGSEPPVSGPRQQVGPLPPIGISFAGPLAGIGRLTPGITTDALTQEITTRRLELEAAELERIRREDEARAKAEAERQARLRAEAEAAAAAARATAPLPGPPPEATPGALSPSTPQFPPLPLPAPLKPQSGARESGPGGAPQTSGASLSPTSGSGVVDVPDPKSSASGSPSPTVRRASRPQPRPADSDSFTLQPGDFAGKH